MRRSTGSRERDLHRYEFHAQMSVLRNEALEAPKVVAEVQRLLKEKI
jgi:hypothetical protein